jgi:hypothetical protein
MKIADVVVGQLHHARNDGFVIPIAVGQYDIDGNPDVIHEVKWHGFSAKAHQWFKETTDGKNRRVVCVQLAPFAEGRCKILILNPSVIEPVSDANGARSAVLRNIVDARIIDSRHVSEQSRRDCIFAAGSVVCKIIGVPSGRADDVYQRNYTDAGNILAPLLKSKNGKEILDEMLILWLTYKAKKGESINGEDANSLIDAYVESAKGLKSLAAANPDPSVILTEEDSKLQAKWDGSSWGPIVVTDAVRVHL